MTLRLRKTLWIAATLVALPASAAAEGQEDVCGALGRIIAAARENPAFGSVAEQLAARNPVIPDFRAEQCEVRAGEGLFCDVSTMGRAIFADWPDLASCPGVTEAEQVLTMDPPPPRTRNAWTRVYQARNVFIAYGVTCPLCAGPATARFSVGFARPFADNQ